MRGRHQRHRARRSGIGRQHQRAGGGQPERATVKPASTVSNSSASTLRADVERHGVDAGWQRPRKRGAFGAIAVEQQSAHAFVRQPPRDPCGPARASVQITSACEAVKAACIEATIASIDGA
jgi:hypothetical protein